MRSSPGSLARSPAKYMILSSAVSRKEDSPAASSRACHSPIVKYLRRRLGGAGGTSGGSFLGGFLGGPFGGVLGLFRAIVFTCLQATRGQVDVTRGQEKGSYRDCEVNTCGALCINETVCTLFAKTNSLHACNTAAVIHENGDTGDKVVTQLVTE